MQLRPYPEYKESGCPAVSKIPLQWQVHRCRYLFREVDERSKDGQEIHLSMSQKHGLIDSAKIDKWRLQSESYAGGKLCKNGDLVLNRLKAHLGVFAQAKQAGVVSPDYTVLRPITDDSPRFFEFLFKSPPFITEFTKSTKGIVKGFWRLYTDNFYSIRSVVPPIEEQRQILRFIDSLTAKINKFIRNKRRLIELLKEQKQHIINQAVTRGLDPNVKLKPSGVEWIGDIPEHWEALTFGRIVKLFKTGPFGSLLHQSDYVSTGVPIVNPVHMSGGRITPDMNCTVDDATCHRLREYALAEGDIVFSRRGELGRCALIREEQAGWLIGTGSILARLSPNTVNHEYLTIALQGRWVADYLSLMSVGATMQSLNTGILNRLPLSLPPLEEQSSIIGFIEKESLRINEAITRTQREIELMREYRTRLIADVVTGQVDVRGIEVPEIAEEELLALEEGSTESDDVIDADEDLNAGE